MLVCKRVPLSHLSTVSIFPRFTLPICNCLDFHHRLNLNVSADIFYVLGLNDTDFFPQPAITWSNEAFKIVIRKYRRLHRRKQQDHRIQSVQDNCRRKTVQKRPVRRILFCAQNAIKLLSEIVDGLVRNYLKGNDI